MIFKLEAEIEFDAKNIEDAFKKLSEHFTKLAEDEESNLINLGEIHIAPVKGG